MTGQELGVYAKWWKNGWNRALNNTPYALGMLPSKREQKIIYKCEKNVIRLSIYKIMNWI